MHSKAVISILSILVLCCMLTASGQRYLLEHLAIMIFGMAVGLVASLYLGENEEMMLLEFNQESFFVMLAPPIFLEAGYNMNRKLFFDHSHSIFMLGIVGTYVNAILFAVCFYSFVSYVDPCGLMIGDSFTMEDSIHLAALIAPTDVVAVLSIFKNIPATSKTKSLISITEGESLVNDGVGIVLFWHTGHAFPENYFPDDWGKITSVVLVPLIFAISILGGSAIAILCAVTTSYTRLKNRPQVEFLITVAFAYLSYFVFAPIPIFSEFISLFSCGFALAHFNDSHLSPESRLATRTLFKSWGWVAETFIFFQIGVNTSVSLHDDSWAWTQSVPVLILALVLMVVLRFIVVLLTCAYLNLFGYETLSWKEQVVLNLASVRGAVSYALCLVWPNDANAETVHTTTLGVVLFTNFFFGSALGPVVRVLFPPNTTPIRGIMSQRSPPGMKGLKAPRRASNSTTKKPRSDSILSGSWIEDNGDGNHYPHGDESGGGDDEDDRALLGNVQGDDYKALPGEPAGRRASSSSSSRRGGGGGGEVDDFSSWLAHLDLNYIRPFFNKVSRFPYYSAQGLGFYERLHSPSNDDAGAAAAAAALVAGAKESTGELGGAGRDTKHNHHHHQQQQNYYSHGRTATTGPFGAGGYQLLDETEPPPIRQRIIANAASSSATRGKNSSSNKLGSSSCSNNSSSSSSNNRNSARNSK